MRLLVSLSSAWPSSFGPGGSIYGKIVEPTPNTILDSSELQSLLSRVLISAAWAVGSALPGLFVAGALLVGWHLSTKRHEALARARSFWTICVVLCLVLVSFYGVVGAGSEREAAVRSGGDARQRLAASFNGGLVGAGKGLLLGGFVVLIAGISESRRRTRSRAAIAGASIRSSPADDAPDWRITMAPDSSRRAGPTSQLVVAPPASLPPSSSPRVTPTTVPSTAPETHPPAMFLVCLIATAIAFFAGVFTITVLFPPWRFVALHHGNFRFAGPGPFAFVSSPPDTPPPIDGQWLDWSAEIDVGRAALTVGGSGVLLIASILVGRALMRRLE